MSYFIAHLYSISIEAFIRNISGFCFSFSTSIYIRYIIVAFQECERMNYLTGEMKRSLRELDLGLKGELTITSEMEVLENALFLDQVPQIWASRAYPSLLGLTNWFVDLLMRLRELEAWSTDFVVKMNFFFIGQKNDSNHIFYITKMCVMLHFIIVICFSYRLACGWPVSLIHSHF